MNAILNYSNLQVILETSENKLIIEPNSFKIFEKIPKIKYYWNKLMDIVKNHELDEVRDIYNKMITNKQITNINDVMDKILILTSNENINAPALDVFYCKKCNKVIVTPSENSFYIDNCGIFKKIDKEIDIDLINDINSIDSTLLIRIIKTDSIKIEDTFTKKEITI